MNTPTTVLTPSGLNPSINPSPVQSLQLATPVNATVNTAVNAMPCTLLVDANQMQCLNAAQHPVQVSASGYALQPTPTSACTFVVDPQDPYRYVCLNCGQVRSLQRADTGINPMLVFIGLAMVAGILLPALQPPTTVPTTPVSHPTQQQ